MKDHWEAYRAPLLHPHVQVVAVPPSPVPIEEALCLFGHSKAYVDEIRPMNVATLLTRPSRRSGASLSPTSCLRSFRSAPRA